MQWLVEMIAGLVALLAAAALSQLGLNLDTPDRSGREVQRVSDCNRDTALAAASTMEETRQGC